MHRVLKENGLMLFSDALVIGGMVSHQEIATRSSIGFYVFSPPGENDRLMKEAGFQIISVTDTSEAAAELAGRWRAAREKYQKELTGEEGRSSFDGLQNFLLCVQTLLKEKRLLRFLYLARKE
jgi:hypothetical protein